MPVLAETWKGVYGTYSQESAYRIAAKDLLFVSIKFWMEEQKQPTNFSHPEGTRPPAGLHRLPAHYESQKRDLDMERCSPYGRRCSRAPSRERESDHRSAARNVP